ncbi:sulfotransferase [Pseudoalteromonas sp. NZS100]|uniref:sulfotransferase family protein n=1 Tax=Pseudoalteromonas sp. NZS100 TaxID=2792046 RepID=UPI0018CCADCD|nr:sulfotransferase [Pseudoalteromonas sp. NZS100]MBH0066670.1 sulfotransferase [Pseudoalteromonas sp. NZS100]
MKTVFIFGCDRSGTTMLADALGCSKSTLVAPEAQFVYNLMDLDLLDIKLNNEVINKYILNDFRYKTWEIHLRKYDIEQAYNSSGYKGIVELIIHTYANKIDRSAFNCWIDHTPTSYQYIAKILDWWPDSKFIHIVRDGRAVFNSIKGLDWGPNNAFCGAKFWSEIMFATLRVEKLLNEVVLRVYYEGYLEDNEAQLYNICEFLEIKFESSLIKGGGLEKPNFTKGYHKLVGEGVDKSRAQEWRNKLTEKEIVTFNSNFKVYYLLEKLGYVMGAKGEECNFINSNLNMLHDKFINFLNRFKKYQSGRY